MPRYTATEEIVFDVYPQERVLVVNAGTGSVGVSVWDGTEYVLDQTITTDSSNVIFTSGLNIRFSVTGDAAFWIDDRGRAQ